MVTLSELPQLFAGQWILMENHRGMCYTKNVIRPAGGREMIRYRKTDHE